jgi:hypothetical protein
MDYQLINKIVDLILENERIQNIDLIRSQRKNLSIEKTEDLGNNKYISFKVMDDDNFSVSFFEVISVMFWELTQNIPIDCILHLKNGCINSLEVYSCDGRNFGDLDISNIDIRDRSPN